MRKNVRNIMSIILSIFVVLTSFPVYGDFTVNAANNEKQIVNEDGVLLHKEANLVDGKLNEWEIDLKLEFDADEFKHDIVLIIDTSGSMKGSRLRDAKRAASAFVDAVLASDYVNVNRIALIEYATGPTVRSNFTNDRQSLNRTINDLSANGGTFTQAAIKYGRDLLDGSSANKKSIVLLTDGSPTFGYDLSYEGFLKYKELPKFRNSNLSPGNYSVSKDRNNIWSYGEHQLPITTNRLMLENDAERNFSELDFEYEKNFGGNGAEALKLSNWTTVEEAYFINLFATAEAEASIAKDKGNDFYTVGLGLGNNSRALEMLSNMATDDSKYFDADNSTKGLNEIFLEIAQDLNFPFKDMVFNDVMGDSVDYVGGLSAVKGSIEHINFESEEYALNGLLNEDNFHYNKDTKKYEFHIKYRVHANDDAIDEILSGNKKILTNEDASFTYTKRKDGTTVESKFPKPSVKPTIFAVEKQLYDEKGHELSLIDNENQREYNYTISSEGFESTGIIKHDREFEYHILIDDSDYTIEEVSITNDDINKYDVTYVMNNDDLNIENKDGKFNLKPESGLNTLSIQNRPITDYTFDDYTLNKEVKDENGNGFVEHDETITYSITLTNNSHEAFIRDVFIQDTLEEIVSYVTNSFREPISVLRNGVKTEEVFEINNIINGLNTHLGVGETLTLKFDLKVVDYGVALPKSFNNTVTSTINNVSKTDNATIDTKYPTIKAKKTVVDQNGNGFAEPGEELTYTINIKNAGEITHNKLFIQDPLTDIEKHVEDINSVEFTMNGETYPISKLMEGFIEENVKPNDEIEIVFTIKLSETLNTFLTKNLDNVARVDKEYANATIETASSKISAEKSVSDSNNNKIAEPNEWLTYTIDIFNDGNVKKEDVIIKDTLEMIESELDRSNFSELGSVVISDGTTETLYTIKDLQKGIGITVEAKSNVTVRFSVKVKKDFNAVKNPKLSNFATVDDIDVSATIDTGMPIITSNKEVFDENSNNFAEANENLRYVITINNDGIVEKNNLWVQDEITELLKHTDAKDKLDKYSVSIDINGSTTTKTLKSLIDGFYMTIPAKSEVKITFNVKVKEDLNFEEVKQIENIALIGDDEPDIIIPTGTPKIESEKKVTDANGDGYAEAGEKLKYVITIYNSGNVTKKNLWVQDSLKDLEGHINNVSNVQMKIDNEDAPLSKLINGFNMDVESGEKIIIEFVVTVKEDFKAENNKMLLNVATIGDENPEVKIPTGNPIIKAKKTVVDENGNGHAEAGERLDYKIVITNSGKVGKKDIFVQDDLEDLLPHIDSVDDEKLLVNEKQMLITDLIKGLELNVPAESKTTLAFSVYVKEEFDASVVKSLSNFATVGDEKPEVKIPTGEPIIVSSKTVIDENDDGFAEAGERLDYTISIKNNGLVEMIDLDVKDTLEDLIDHIDDITETVVLVNGKARPLQDLVDGFMIDVPAHAEVNLNFSVKVRDDFDASSVAVLSNLAIIGNNKPSVEIPTGKAIIKFNKTVQDENNDGFAEAGERLDYTILIKNIGNVEKKDLYVQDTLEHLIEHIDTIENTHMMINEDKRPLNDLIEGFNIDVIPHKDIEISFSVNVKDNFDSDKVKTLLNIVTVGEEEHSVEIPSGKAEIISRKLVVDDNKNGFAEAGEQLHYSITIGNIGEVKKTNLFVQDNLKDLMGYIKDISSVSVAVNDTEIQLKELKKGFNLDVDAGEQVVIQFTVVLKDNFDASKVKYISNLATVGNDDPIVNIPTGMSNIIASKHVVDQNKDGFADTKERLDYTIKIENIGTVSDDNVFVQDTLAELLPHIENIDDNVVYVGTETYTLQQLVDGFSIQLDAREKIELKFSVTLNEGFDTSQITVLNNVATVNDLIIEATINTKQYTDEPIVSPKPNDPSTSTPPKNDVTKNDTPSTGVSNEFYIFVIILLSGVTLLSLLKKGDKASK